MRLALQHAMPPVPTQRLTSSRLANLGAGVIRDAFDAYDARFRALTRRARERFEHRDWTGMQRDATARLDLYKQVVRQAEGDVRALLSDRVEDKLIWTSMKAVYSGLIDARNNWELAETFFNSITRRIFDTVGVDPQIEFVDTDFDQPPTPSSEPVYRTYHRPSTTALLVETLLADSGLRVPFADQVRDVQAVAARIDAHLRTLSAERGIDRADIIRPVFYRGMGAYIVGRLTSGPHLVPLVLALHHPPEGVLVDAVLLHEDAVSILFSFAHSYFHVDVGRPYDLTRFLNTLVPRKRLAELYISLGYNKHGKTELYRDLLQHLAATDDTFGIAPGKRGMVMAVFTMPSYDVVFKVIRDQFAPPKNTTRQAIMDKYALVFRHDRAGRLVDAQAFEHLTFDRRRFASALLGELLAEAGRTVHVEGEQVVVEHAYVERRVTPLDLYVREAPAAEARAAVLDYGQAIKDLAASNIFPGDLLLKNFGVTRHGRVVFYDYDELALLTDCRFRTLPAPRSYEEEIAAEPWFYVHENDIFPEEFAQFLGLTGPLRDLFLAHHGDLFTSAFWQRTQDHIRAGQVMHILPYTQQDRLQHRQDHAALHVSASSSR